MVARKPHAIDTTDSEAPEPSDALRAVLNATPGALAISATVMYDDGRIERVTVTRPARAILAIVQ